MRWHFNVFNLDSGRKGTKFEHFVDRLVNVWVPVGLYWLLYIVFYGGIVYIAQHFIIKYW